MSDKYSKEGELVVETIPVDSIVIKRSIEEIKTALSEAKDRKSEKLAELSGIESEINKFEEMLAVVEEK